MQFLFSAFTLFFWGGVGQGASRNLAKSGGGSPFREKPMVELQKKGAGSFWCPFTPRRGTLKTRHTMALHTSFHALGTGQGFLLVSVKCKKGSILMDKSVLHHRINHVPNWCRILSIHEKRPTSTSGTELTTPPCPRSMSTCVAFRNCQHECRKVKLRALRCVLF